jgi:hypothetical protein
MIIIYIKYKNELIKYFVLLGVNIVVQMRSGEKILVF